MSKNKNKINYVINSALIAAFYVALTFLGNISGLSYVPVQLIQLRISEVLTVLPLITPAAIPGLTVGCFIANIASFNILDMFFGSVATLIAAYLTYILRNIKIKGLPILALLPPVLVNAFIIGLEISIFLLKSQPFWIGFFISALQVGIGQMIICYGLGIPFYLIVNKYKVIK